MSNEKISIQLSVIEANIIELVRMESLIEANDLRDPFDQDAFDPFEVMSGIKGLTMSLSNLHFRLTQKQNNLQS